MHLHVYMLLKYTVHVCRFILCFTCTSGDVQYMYVCLTNQSVDCQSQACAYIHVHVHVDVQ